MVSNITTEINKLYINWSNTYQCIPKNTYYPNDEDQIITILQISKDLGLKVRAVGGGLSPSDIACTNDIMINLKNLNKIVDVDRSQNLVRVQAGITLRELCHRLDGAGFALSNLGSVSQQSLAGAIATGVHGTGLNHGIFSTHVHEISFITSSCERKTAKSTDDNTDLFNAMLCNLGCLGIVTEVVLKVEPKSTLRSVQYPASLNYILSNLDEVLKSGEHVRFWWFPHVAPKPHNCFIWKANRISRKDPSLDLINRQGWLAKTWERFIRVNVYEFSLYLGSFFPSLVPWINTFYFRKYFDKTVIIEENCHDIFTFDCLFSQFVSEWSIPIEKTKLALEAIDIFLKDTKINFKAHFPIEVRFVQKDDILLSNAYGQTVCYIGIISYRPFGKFIPHKVYWDKFEQIMMNLGGRPHWAKAHPLNRDDLAKVYPKLDTFLKIREDLDPSNTFVNEYIQRHLLN